MYAQIFILLIREKCKDLFKLLLCAIFQEDTLSCKKIVIMLFFGPTMTEISNFGRKILKRFCLQRKYNFTQIQIADKGEGGVANPEKLPTLFMDGP